MMPFEESMLKLMTDFFVASMGMSMMMFNFSAQLLNQPKKPPRLILVKSR
jgi:hypothetical protein